MAPAPAFSAAEVAALWRFLDQVGAVADAALRAGYWPVGDARQLAGDVVLCWDPAMGQWCGVKTTAEGDVVVIALAREE